MNNWLLSLMISLDERNDKRLIKDQDNYMTSCNDEGRNNHIRMSDVY